MAYDFSTGGSTSVTASELVVSVFDQVESGFYDALYPDVLWRTVIPQDCIKT